MAKGTKIPHCPDKKTYAVNPGGSVISAFMISTGHEPDITGHPNAKFVGDVLNHPSQSHGGTDCVCYIEGKMGKLTDGRKFRLGSSKLVIPNITHTVEYILRRDPDGRRARSVGAGGQRRWSDECDDEYAMGDEGKADDEHDEHDEGDGVIGDIHRVVYAIISETEQSLIFEYPGVEVVFGHTGDCLVVTFPSKVAEMYDSDTDDERRERRLESVIRRVAEEFSSACNSAGVGDGCNIRAGISRPVLMYQVGFGDGRQCDVDHTDVRLVDTWSEKKRCSKYLRLMQKKDQKYQEALDHQQQQQALERLTSDLERCDVSPSYSTAVGLDCEMVTDFDGRHMLARMSLVGRRNAAPDDPFVLLDVFVRPQLPVKDYLTHVSGVTPELIDERNPDAVSFPKVRGMFVNAVANNPNVVLVGHGLDNDLAALQVRHDELYCGLEDSAKDPACLRKSNNKARKLKDLCSEHLGIEVQPEGESHCSVDDAWNALQLRWVLWESSFDDQRYSSCSSGSYYFDDGEGYGDGHFHDCCHDDSDAS